MDLSDIFDEWDIYAGGRALKERYFDYDAAIENAERKIVAVTGIRRSGKSSLLMLLRQRLAKMGAKVCYVNLEDSRIKSHDDALDALLKWFGDEGFMLLDEITAIPGWEGWLARVHEQLKGRLKLIISSSRKSLSMPSKPLRGRIVQFELFPLSFKEYLFFIGARTDNTTAGRGIIEKAFNDYLRYGGFPEIALASNRIDKIRYLNSYFNDIISLDIAEVSNEEISLVETFARYALQSSYFSASKCLNFFETLGYKIGKERILKMERHAQLSYLFSFLPIFSHSIKDIKQYPRKSYSGDTGFYYGITGRTDLGLPFEALIFLELRRRLKPGNEIAYWKNKNGAEADFLIKQGIAVKEIVQVAYAINEKETKNREVTGAIEACKAFGLKRATIITSGTESEHSYEGIKIRFRNVVDWLLYQ
ncbi:MAG: ATP-binding protein [Candidatus Micrarchaeaceae archaeon]